MTHAVPHRKPRFFQSIFFKATAIVLVCTAVVSAILAYMNYSSAYRTARTEAQDHVAAISPLIARGLSGALRFDKAPPATEVLTALIEETPEEGLGAIAIRPDGTVLSQVMAGGDLDQLTRLAQQALDSNAPARSGDAMTYAIPVTANDAVVGALAIEWSAEKPLAAVKAQLQTTLLLTAAVFLCALSLAAWAFSRIIVRPLTLVNTAMSRVADADYSTDIPGSNRHDEIGTIAASLEAFRASLAASSEANRLALMRGAALSASSTAIMLTDNAHRITYVNQGMIALMQNHAAALRETTPGFDPNAMLGTRADTLLAHGTQVASALATGKADTMRIEQELSSGALVVDVNPVLDETGTKIGHVAEWRDVTNGRHNAAILNAIDTTQARAEFSPSGILQAANDVFCQALSAPSAQLIGTDFSEVLSHKGATGSQVFDNLNHGDNITGHIQIHRHDGQTVIIDGAFGPVRDRDGQVLLHVLLGMDVTDAVATLSRAEAARASNQAEQHHVVDALRTALSQLSEGDLTMPITTPFPSTYETLRQDYNRATANLLSAMHCVLENAELIRTETRQISSAASDLSQRTEQQAATLEQTAAALNQLTSSVKSAADGAARANDMVAHAKTHAETSGNVVREAVLAMGEIEVSSSKISKITSVIDEIAFQTNLLALNAGVEAARAGEAGRGFAVVASEVRALAQRSSDAAREIAGLISSSSTQVRRGVDLVGQAGEALSGIQTSVGDIFTCVSDIAVSTREQSAGLSEINTAVSQLDQVTQRNAAMFEQTSSASISLAREAEALGTTMARFRLGTSVPAAPGGFRSTRSESTLTAAPPQAVQPMPQVQNTKASLPAPRSAPLPAPSRRLTALAVKPSASEDEWEDF
jgi:methyl-accepting chemotaxis protein